MATAINSFNPIGGNASIISQISPTIVDPIVDIYLNQDWIGRPIYPKEWNERVPKPLSERYFQSVTGASQMVAEKVNELTGGNQVRPGWASFSPEVTDYLFD